MHFSSPNELPLFLSRAWYTMHACKRLLEGSGHGYLAETAHVPVSAIAFSAQPAACGPPQPTASGALQPAAIRSASDDDDAAESDEAEPCVDRDADEEPARTSSEEEEEVIMQDLKTTSTRIDDWLHRGPFLQ